MKRDHHLIVFAKDLAHARDAAPLAKTVIADPGQSRSAILSSLGWSDFFEHQLEPYETGLEPVRIDGVHRARLTALSETGQISLTLPVHAKTTDYAVGDWVLAEPHTHLLHRRLERKTVLERRNEASRMPQLTAANVDTLFIVTSCNADFNPARLERYLALANQAGSTPVIVLTKADTSAEGVRDFEQQARALQRDLAVIALDARAPNAATLLARWCGLGQTVALIGSSGVGKSTLLNTLAGPGQNMPQLTGDIRESDAKGRHTTTARSLHAIASGGWVIDTPGIRTLHVSDVADGIDTLFAEITELTPLCKFRDCTHAHEPGCAVLAALAAGKIDPERLARWRKLLEENRDNTPAAAGARGGSSGRKRR